MENNDVIEEMDYPQFFEEQNGQYSFFDIKFKKNKLQGEDALLLFIQNSHKRALELKGLKEEYQKFESLSLDEEDKKKYRLSVNQLFTSFIKDYFSNFFHFSYEEILKKYENFSNYYHLLGKLFLFYLDTFIYNNQTENIFDENLVIQMENFIEADTTKYRDPYYVSIIKTKLLEHKKLRVNAYILYHLQPFLDKVKQIAKTFTETEEIELLHFGKRKEVGAQIYNEMKRLQEDSLLQTTIFKESREFIEKENQDILVVLFLKYLEYCVYFDSYDYPNERFNHFVAKIEDFVVFHFHDTICLSNVEEKVYSLAMKGVAERLSSYVKKEGQSLLSVLHDYDTLQHLQSSGKFKMIAWEEPKDNLATVYSEEEIKFKLKTFLETVFMLSNNIDKKRLPIFLAGFEAVRNVALKLGLEYLWRYVYSISEEEKFDDYFVIRLENFIASCDFLVREVPLCAAKSILYKRVNVRNVFKEPSLRRKVLKSKKS